VVGQQAKGTCRRGHHSGGQGGSRRKKAGEEKAI